MELYNVYSKQNKFFHVIEKGTVSIITNGKQKMIETENLELKLVKLKFLFNLVFQMQRMPVFGEQNTLKR